MDHPDARPTWTFLTNHARVLIMIAREPGVRLRDMAVACGITERTVQGIVADLEEAGYLAHTRDGRRNRYKVIPGTQFRHPAESGLQVAGLLALINGDDRGGLEHAGGGHPSAGAGQVGFARADDPAGFSQAIDPASFGQTGADPLG